MVPGFQAKCLAQQPPQEKQELVGWGVETMVALISSLGLPGPERNPALTRSEHMVFLGTETIFSNRQT